jgi:hypothetical protein
LLTGPVRNVVRPDRDTVSRYLETSVA